MDLCSTLIIIEKERIPQKTSRVQNDKLRKLCEGLRKNGKRENSNGLIVGGLKNFFACFHFSHNNKSWNGLHWIEIEKKEYAEERLFSVQIGLEYCQKWKCRYKNMKVINSPLCFQTRFPSWETFNDILLLFSLGHCR